jgi:hypothetical protein
MENQSEDILENLTFVNGKEEVEETPTPKGKAKKKSAKKSVNKKQYSYEELTGKSMSELENISKKLGIPAEGVRKFDIIQNILGKN